MMGRICGAKQKQYKPYLGVGLCMLAWCADGMASGPCVGVMGGMQTSQGQRTDLVDTFALAYEKSFRSHGPLGYVSAGYEWSFLFPFVRTEAYVGYDQSVSDAASMMIPAGPILYSRLQKGWMSGLAVSGGLSLGVVSPYVKVAFGWHQLRYTYRQEVSGSTVYTHNAKTAAWAPSLGLGLRAQLLGLAAHLEYLYTDLSSAKSISYDSVGWEINQSLKHWRAHAVMVGVSYVF
ncbi:hypothetical protein EIL50_04255 [bacterium NHP-B]|nr:hypothetical protein EIL50_04255 [bacterium NHP-B]